LVYSRELYKKYKKELSEVEKIEIGDVDLAVKTYYVFCCMFSGGGDYNAGFAFSKVKNFALRYWRSLDTLVKVRERLSNVIIECDDFENVIKRWDSKETYFLLDPPYYGSEGYYNGFGRKDHERLLRLLKEVKGKWLLSGYANELYNKELKDYNKFEFELVKRSHYIAGSGSGFMRPRVKEVLWCNYEVKDSLFV
jgi:DNA adenine methylase